MKKYLLIDGFNLMYRCFYAIQNLTRADGMPTNAIYGWVKTLVRLKNMQQPEKIIVFFDLGGGQRQLDLFSDYKANRKDTPEALIIQIPLIKKLTGLMGYQVFQRQGVEADDCIASAAHTLGIKSDNEVMIVSADKDFAQCLNPSICQLLPPPTANPKLGYRILQYTGVKEKFGVQVHQIPDYLAIIGDVSDNIPGISGAGPKTVASWLNTYEDLEAILAAADVIRPERFRNLLKENADNLRRNRAMILLNTSLPFELTDAKEDTEGLLSFLQEMEIKL